MANNLLLILAVVIGVLFLSGGLTGNFVNPRQYQYRAPTINIPAAPLSTLEQSQETKLTKLQTQIQTMSSESWSHYVSSVQADVSINNKLDLIGENMALSATDLGCNCICRDAEPDRNGHYGAHGKACVKACVVHAGSPGGDQSAICDEACKTYCGGVTAVSAKCKPECANPPI